jgi:phospholipase/carboxylesterase
MPQLDGPRREPRRGPVEQLVVLLHGYGANGDDLIGLGDACRGVLPRAAFVAPNAPEILPYSGISGRQWFPLTFSDPGEYGRGVVAAGPLLDRFLDAELERYRLAPSRLALVGFSQGTMMALHVGLRRPESVAAIVGFSGLIAAPERLQGELRSRPFVQLIHGDQDDMIPVEALHFTREALGAAGIPVEWHVRPGLGHGIDPEGLMLAAGFLQWAFEIELPGGARA